MNSHVAKVFVTGLIKLKSAFNVLSPIPKGSDNFRAGVQYSPKVKSIFASPSKHKLFVLKFLVISIYAYVSIPTRPVTEAIRHDILILGPTAT